MGTTIESVAVVTGDRLHRSARKLADRAIREATAAAGLVPRDIDLLLNAGIFHERNLGEPALAALLQEDVGANPEGPHEGAHGTFSFDVANGSAGALSALQIADGFLRSRTIRHAVVVASDADPGHRLAPKFPFDPTAAALVCSWEDGPGGVLGFRWGARPEAADQRTAVLRFERGRNVLLVHEEPTFVTEAAECAGSTAAALLADHGLAVGDVDVIAAAPFDGAFIDALVARLGVSADRVVRPRGPHRFHTAGLIAAWAGSADVSRTGGRGERVLLVAAGSGITAGAALVAR